MHVPTPGPSTPRLARAVVAFALVALLGSPLFAGDEPDFLDLKWKRRSIGQTTGDSALAVDAAGNLHALVVRDIKGLFVLTHVWYEGRKRRTEIVTEQDVGSQVALAVDDDGGVHVAYSTMIAGGWLLNHGYKPGDQDDAGWTHEPVGVGGQSISMQVDDAGVPHVVHINGNGTPEVRYARRTAEGWVSELVADDGLWFGDTCLLLRDGQVFVTYTTHGFTRPLQLATRDALGGWTLEELAPNGTEASAAFDILGDLHVVYTDGKLMHTFQTPGGWETEEFINSNEFFGQALPEGVTAHVEDTAAAMGPQGRLLLVGTMHLSKGNKFANSVFVAPFDGQFLYPDLLKVSPSIRNDIELVTDAHGMAHLAVAKGNGTTFYHLKGKRLRLGVGPKGAGEVTASVGDRSCDSRCRMEFFPGLDVTLTATAAPGFAFDEWRGAGEGTDPECTVTMDGNRKVKARFTPVD